MSFFCCKQNLIGLSVPSSTMYVSVFGLNMFNMLCWFCSPCRINLSQFGCPEHLQKSVSPISTKKLSLIVVVDCALQKAKQGIIVANRNPIGLSIPISTMYVSVFGLNMFNMYCWLCSPCRTHLSQFGYPEHLQQSVSPISTKKLNLIVVIDCSLQKAKQGTNGFVIIDF